MGTLETKEVKIQIPLIMYKRNSIARDDGLANTMNRNVSYSTLTKYNKKQKYDKFSLMNEVNPNVERTTLQCLIM